MLKHAFVSVAFVLALAAAANASTVTYTITADTTVIPMTWSVYASVSEDTNGLANFYIHVLATGDLQILTSRNRTPNPPFSQIRSNGSLTKYPQESYAISGGLPVIYSGGNDPELDALVVQGLGIGTPLLVAGGTFSGTAGTLTVAHDDGIVSVLRKVSGGPWVGPGNCSTAFMPTPTLANGGVVTVNVPEPGTLTLLALGGAAMIRRRRRV